MVSPQGIATKGIAAPGIANQGAPSEATSSEESEPPGSPSCNAAPLPPSFLPAIPADARPPVWPPRSGEKSVARGAQASSARPRRAARFAESPLVREFRRRHFPGVSRAEWNDWRWQTRNRVRTLAQFERIVELSDDERQALVQRGSMLPVGVTPYYLSLVDPVRPEQGLRRTVIPTTAELVRTRGEADDPLGEDAHSPAPGLVHRYPDRVLLLALDFCATYCRYCTRSRVVGHGEILPNEERLEQAFAYLRLHTEIRDVLISGGDPLALGEDRLEWILGKLREIPHVEFIRLGTKMPAVLPQRITPQLCRMLRKFHPFWMSVHFLHPDECTLEAARACARLADAGIPLGSQTVLLAGVNDDVPTMQELMHKLLMMRVRPYYLYQCDPISGSAHFRTSVAKGLKIMEALRGHTTGYAVPTLVIDAPGGGGKIPIAPSGIVGREGDDLLLRNFEGKVFRYSDPMPRPQDADGVHGRRATERSAASGAPVNGAASGAAAPSPLAGEAWGGGAARGVVVDAPANGSATPAMRFNLGR
ncbi:MAG: KamA family radical SAM protein [Planctomycetia bacterium]|nr:KamA family radical SAM protein [Planctomycetia bacterium]